MLDSFEIVSTSGVVLWKKSYIPISEAVVNSLINEVFIEERAVQAPVAGQAPSFKKDKYTLKWTTVREFGLIFVAVYQSILHLSWVDKLLENIKTIFVNIYKDQLKAQKLRVANYKFDQYFEQQVRELEGAAGPIVAEQSQIAVSEKKDALSDSDNGGPPPPPMPHLLKAQPMAASGAATSEESTPAATPDSSRPSTPLANHLLTGKNTPAGRLSRRAKKAANTAVSSGEENVKKGKSKATPAKSAVKKMRKWDANGMADDDDGANLDYSVTADADTDGVAPAVASVEGVAQDSWGKKTGKGEFVLKDLEDEVHSILANAESEKSKDSASGSKANGMVSSGFGAIGGYFRNIVGGKTLTKADLEAPLKQMHEHLLKKNVAPEAAARLCAGVEEELVGKKTGSFQSIDSALRDAMEKSLHKILTPTSSLDLLREIQAVRTQSNPRPYVISMVGVNGVGKSTNLSKICYFLLQNNYKVLVAACDTFRSGAVEQLRVHERNLKELSAREGVGAVELFARGYGKDAANVAKDAVTYGANSGFDVILIDTAGRRHNDARLMSSLEKFAKLANPDKIFMVGEALVGNDSVMQARNFNAAFGAGRGLDGFIISKCDTVGDMVGTLVSMVHATGIPIVFLGVGQHYGDLRGLSVGWAVGLLMQ